MKRRNFLRTAGFGSLLLGSTKVFSSLERIAFAKVTILHTNDWHSRIDPFPEDGSRNAGLGGASRRAAMIDRIRKEEDHVLLLDAGDIMQGTPYFNMFKGELEWKLMKSMGYDAATIGNHDFDAGIQQLAKLTGQSFFPMVNCNYEFNNTPMDGYCQPYIIREFDGIKIGITGAGIKLKGLVPDKLYGETNYLDPVTKVENTASMLKGDMDCDYVVCLSHLGYQYRNNPEKVSDLHLATNTSSLDLIIGGHTHTFLDSPVVVKNRKDQAVLITQVGWAGIKLGRIEVFFERNRRNRCVSCRNDWVTPFDHM